MHCSEICISGIMLKLYVNRRAAFFHPANLEVQLGVVPEQDVRPCLVQLHFNLLEKLETILEVFCKLLSLDQVTQGLHLCTGTGTSAFAHTSW